MLKKAPLPRTNHTNASITPVSFHWVRSDSKSRWREEKITANPLPSWTSLKSIQLTWKSTVLWNKNKLKRKWWHCHSRPSGDSLQTQSQKAVYGIKQNAGSWGPCWGHTGGQEWLFLGWASVYWGSQRWTGNGNSCRATKKSFPVVAHRPEVWALLLIYLKDRGTLLL